jgi:hypothetical protein
MKPSTLYKEAIKLSPATPSSFSSLPYVKFPVLTPSSNICVFPEHYLNLWRLINYERPV